MNFRARFFGNSFLDLS